MKAEQGMCIGCKTWGKVYLMADGSFFKCFKCHSPVMKNRVMKEKLKRKEFYKRFR